MKEDQAPGGSKQRKGPRSCHASSTQQKPAVSSICGCNISPQKEKSPQGMMPKKMMSQAEARRENAQDVCSVSVTSRSLLFPLSVVGQLNSVGDETSGNNVEKEQFPGGRKQREDPSCRPCFRNTAENRYFLCLWEGRLNSKGDKVSGKNQVPGRRKQRKGQRCLLGFSYTAEISYFLCLWVDDSSTNDTIPRENAKEDQIQAEAIREKTQDLPL